MLIKFDGIEIPKLKTEKPTATTKKESSIPRTKPLIDDSLAVKEKMEQLFSKYNWKTITTEKELIDYLNTAEDFGLDTETTGLDAFKDKLVGFSIGTEDTCVYIPLTHKVGQNYEGDLKVIEKILKSKNIYGFNGKFDMKFLKQQAKFTFTEKWDGFLAARLMNSSEPSNELKELYIKYVDPNAEFYSFSSLFKRPFDMYDPAIVGAYAAVDAMKHIALGKIKYKER